MTKGNKCLRKYAPSLLLFLLFEAVAVTLWLTKDNLFYLLNFSYIGGCLAAGTVLFTAGKRYARHFVQLAVGSYIPVEGQDDELGIAMFAFHEAAMAYQSGRGSFLKLAAAAIRNRLIDYQRMEQRHAGHISLDQTVDGDAEGRTLLETIDTGHDEIAHRQELGAAQEEIMQFARELAQYGLRLTDIAENCPKQERTLAACHRVLSCAREHPAYLEQLTATGKLPIAVLSAESGVDRKTMERHRKYLVALLLAFTNGFEIIRGHLRQMARPVKEVK